MRQYVSRVSIVGNEEIVFYLLSKDDVLKEISKVVKEISEVLGLPSSTLVRLLLNYFHWDKNTLTGTVKKNFSAKENPSSLSLDRYWEDPDRLFQTLKLPNPNASPSISYNPLSPPTDSEQNPLSTSASTLILCKT